MISRLRSIPWWFLTAVILYLFLHARAVVMPPLYDDWPVIEMSHAAFAEFGAIGGFWRIISEPIGGFWRPFHILLTGLVWGESAVILQLLKLAAIIGLSLLFTRLARLTGLPVNVSYAAGAALLLHQSMVWGGEIDRWGDVLMGFAVVGMLLHALQNSSGSMSRGSYVSLAALWTLIALGGKEGGVVLAVIPAVAAVLLASGRVQRNSHVAAAAGSAAVVVLYLAVRYLMGIGVASADPTDDYYRMEFGANVLRNLGLITFALLSPVNTIRVVIDSDGWFAAGAISAVIWAAVILWGLYTWIRRDGVRWPLLLALLFVAVQGPSLLMRNISEQNIARSLPFGILLAALALWNLWLNGTQRRKAMIGLLLGVTFLLHIQATWSKVGHLARAAERGRNFRDAVTEMMPSPPPRPVVFLAERSYHGYSVYVQPLWRSLPGDADSGLRLRYRDPSYSGVVVLKDFTVDTTDAPVADFTLDRNNWLSGPDGRQVQIFPLDPYVGRKLKR